MSSVLEGKLSEIRHRRLTHLSRRTVLAIESGAKMNAVRGSFEGGNGTTVRGVCEATNEKVNVLPLPTPAKAAVQLPPISSASCCEMARPRPDPLCERVMLESIWLNGLNRREIF